MTDPKWLEEAKALAAKPQYRCERMPDERTDSIAVRTNIVRQVPCAPSPGLLALKQALAHIKELRAETNGSMLALMDRNPPEKK